MKEQSKYKLENINIEKIEKLFSPVDIKDKLPCSEQVSKTVFNARNTINNILTRKDRRMLGVVGPCSIHDEAAALEYAQKLKVLREKVSSTMYLVMRVYFEKPRTTLGWRGLLIDPDMDNSNNISRGLNLGRQILLNINELGVPTGSEYLDPIVPNYIDDLVCWASIGARTIESQTHRDMASGVSVPVGFKNSTDGEVINAVNAMVLSATPRGFIGINKDGETSMVHTKGNKHTHLILRGGRSGPNYFPEYIDEASEAMKAAGMDPRIVIDCSHGNSLKKYKNQKKVFYSVVEQRIGGEENLLGFMLESNLKEGNQPLMLDKIMTELASVGSGDDATILSENTGIGKRVHDEKLEYGVSVTDACISFEETEELIMYMHELLKKYSIKDQYGI